MVTSNRFAACMFVLLAACTSRNGGPEDAGPPDSGAAEIDAGPREDEDASAPLDASMAPSPEEVEATRSLVREVLCGALARAACESPAQCDCEAPVAGATSTECVASLTEECALRVLDLTQLGRGLMTGRVRVDESALRGCAADLEAAAAACVASDWVSACRAAFLDGAAIGESCTGGIRCAEGAGACNWEGRCAFRPARAQSCELVSDCLEGVCREQVYGPHCSYASSVGERCVIDRDCAAGLRCQAGACTSEPAPTCSAAAPCATGVCAAGRCYDRASVDCGSSCRLPPQAGEPCTRTCAAGLECIGSVCGPPPSEGEFCNLSVAPDASCGPGLVCYGGLCTRGVARGESCVRRPCDRGLECLETGVCAPLPLEGQPCQSPGALCAEGLTCQGDVCVPPEPGSPCTGDWGCPSGYRCSNFACRPALGLGGLCREDRSRCEDGLDCDPLTDTCITASSTAGRACSWACAGGLSCEPDDSICRPQSCRVTWLEGF